ncbi:MAG: oxidoreductase [Candidatus Pelagibacterales bacterium]|nr:MAG: oxidoreductase [Pelagibacterales bacterium]|tara:strand:+ start:218 stop:1282 length:1065 start_codon:yes stop_codon:yes gene_type:complete
MIFKKIKINKVILKNKITVSPMCQYSAIDGCPSDWHYKHLGKLNLSGAGLLMMESTAINNEGKITHSDLCLKNSKQEKSFKKLFNYLKKLNDTPIGIQLSHAGRKGSSFIPWIKSNTPLDKKNNLWQTFAPSALKKDKNWPIPKELNAKKMELIINDFKNTVRKAKNIGFDCIEIHMAHGYLLHQFLSPISNLRIDEYGGNLKNRFRFPLKIAKEVRKIWPKNKILGARITGTDHLKKGISINESILFVRELKKIGFDYVCVSSGGILTKTNLKFKKGFRVNLCKKIKKKTSIITRTSGLIKDIKYANKIIEKGSADLLAIGRSFINDPMLIYKGAKQMKIKNIIEPQYNRMFD